MKVPKTAVPTSVIFLLFAGTSLADDSVTLQYKMSKGDDVIYRSVVEREYRATIDGNERVGNQTREWICSLKLDATDADGDFHVTVRNHRLKAVHRRGTGSDSVYSFDSRSKEREPATGQAAAYAAIYQRLSSQVFQAVISPQGEVKDVKGCSDYWRDLMQDQYFNTARVGAGSDEIAKAALQKQLPALSYLPVKPGDTWELVYWAVWPKHDRFSGNSTGKSMYRFVGPDKVGQRATLKFELSLEGTEGRDFGDGNLQSGTITNSSGTLQFDPAAGRVVLNQMTYTMPMQSTRTQDQFRSTVKETVEWLEKLPD